MPGTQLRQLMDLFEKAEGPLTLSNLAADLGVSRERVEGLVDFWLRKGRLKVNINLADCGSCGIRGECTLLLDQPVMYELADPGQVGEAVS
jgi:hypothetical protein